MPLYKTIAVSQKTTVYIWKVTESLNNLMVDIKLREHCQERMARMKSEIHKRGFASIRHLLAKAGYQDADLYYDEVGKPHLRDGKFISITHSHHFTGIIVSSEREAGIDIEMQRNKILRIASKFTPIREYRTLANDEAVMRKLTIVWGAKESLYKIYGTQGVSFLQHINVTDFDLDDSDTTAKITYHGKESWYDVSFLEFEGFTCVYALKK